MHTVTYMHTHTHIHSQDVNMHTHLYIHVHVYTHIHTYMYVEGGRFPLKGCLSFPFSFWSPTLGARPPTGRGYWQSQRPISRAPQCIQEASNSTPLHVSKPLQPGGLAELPLFCRPPPGLQRGCVGPFVWRYEETEGQCGAVTAVSRSSHCPSSSWVSYQQRSTPVWPLRQTCNHVCLKVFSSLFFHHEDLILTAWLLTAASVLWETSVSSVRMWENIPPLMSEVHRGWWPRDSTLAAGRAFDGLSSDLPPGVTGGGQRMFKLIASDSESCIIKTQMISNGHV